jgi:phosphoglycerate dehydrogenase-like enzyme
MTPTIVLAHFPGLDLYTDADLRRLAEVGTLLDPEPIFDRSEPRTAELLADAEVVLGHWGCPPFDEAMLALAPRLGLLAYAAGTVKGVVTDPVFDRGIRVTSGAVANARPVAEFTLAAILLANKDALWVGAPREAREVPIGNWDKTIGIVGASMVGRGVIDLLRPFPHLRVSVYDPFLSSAEASSLGVQKVELDELCATADVLSIHAPDLPSTKGMIGAPHLAALKTGATVINTARPALIDQDALIAELQAGRLTAVLDVTDPEPLPADHALHSLPNAFVTPHLAGSEGTELGRLADAAIDEIERWSRGEPASNEVTKDQLHRLA